MENAMRDKVSFSTVIDGVEYHTFINLEECTMTVRKDVKTVEITNEGKLNQKEKNNSKEEVLFFGTIEEFKALKEIKVGSFSDRIYKSVLDMSEYLIQAFSKA